jgi:hypothetical protein
MSASDRADAFSSSLGHPEKRIATQYKASIVCNFELNRSKAAKKSNSVLWSKSYTRSKFFPAGNELGALGKTAGLINESNFGQTLSELIDHMSGDAYEGLFK